MNANISPRAEPTARLNAKFRTNVVLLEALNTYVIDWILLTSLAESCGGTNFGELASCLARVFPLYVLKYCQPLKFA